MGLYRKKPVVIEAIEWDESHATLEKIGCGYMAYNGHRDRPDEVRDLRIKTLEGTMNVNKGDYIIKGVQGEFYPCKPDIFAESYELVEPSPKGK